MVVRPHDRCRRTGGPTRRLADQGAGLLALPRAVRVGNRRTRERNRTDRRAGGRAGPGTLESAADLRGLIAWSLSTATFPTQYPRSPGWSCWWPGSAAPVFLLGLLADEASHAAVARRNGIEVDSITLWLFGGVAQLHGKAAAPGVELRVARVGPLVSLLLGAGYGLLAAGLGTAGLTGPLVGACVWLAGVNVLLAVFNPIPAAPLDGGRMLRAALWHWRGDPLWATVTAARAGRIWGSSWLSSASMGSSGPAGSRCCGWASSAGSWPARPRPRSSRPCSRTG